MIAALDRLLARLRAVFHKGELDDDFAAELAHHLELLTEDNIRAGMDAVEAKRQAHLALGGVEQTRELHREIRGLPLLEQLGQDLRYSLRLLRRERGFAFIALLIIAVGVGLNVTVFSLVNTVLLRPLPFAEAKRLVWIENGNQNSPDRVLSIISSTVDTWEGLAESNRTLDAIEAYEPFSLFRTYRLTGDDQSETINAINVSPGLFPMLGVAPLHGRLFFPKDAVVNAAPVTLLSYQLWQRRFHGDPGIVGRTISINGNAITIVGIMPQEDAFMSTVFPAVRVDIYTVLINETRRNSGNDLALIGRMKPGVTIDDAAKDLEQSVVQLQQQYPGRGTAYSATPTPLHDHVAAGLRQPLLFLWTAAGILIAIVGFNLGGLLLARGAARRNEMALRAALGAGRGRIIRQLLTECGILVVIGSIFGVFLAAACIEFLSVRSAVEIPLLQTIHLDTAALIFALGLCVITTLLCGIAPAWSLTFAQRERFDALKEVGRASTTTRGLARARSILVVLEVALACALAISAGLVVRSLYNVFRIDLGFKPENLIAVRIDPLIDQNQLPVYLESILDQTRAMPGVQTAGFTDCIPIERDRSWYIGAKDDPKVDLVRDGTNAHIRIITPGLLTSMGTPLLAGRDFIRLDTRDKRVIIVNSALARHFWPNESAVGNYITFNGSDSYRVIGVAADVRHEGPEVPSGFEMYLPMRLVGGNSWDLMVRTTLPINTFAAQLKSVLQPIDPSLPLTQVREVGTLVDRAVSSRRITSMLIAGFAAMALSLAALGLYGVIAYNVAQRRKEIGIRMALGASGATVRREVVARTLRLAIFGTLMGVAAAIAGARFLQALLYEISSSDPGTFIIMIVAVLTCALLAGYLPARRASRIDPIQALRTD